MDLRCVVGEVLSRWANIKLSVIEERDILTDEIVKAINNQIAIGRMGTIPPKVVILVPEGGATVIEKPKGIEVLVCDNEGIPTEDFYSADEEIDLP